MAGGVRRTELAGVGGGWPCSRQRSAGLRSSRTALFPPPVAAVVARRRPGAGGGRRAPATPIWITGAGGVRAVLVVAGAADQHADAQRQQQRADAGHERGAGRGARPARRGGGADGGRRLAGRPSMRQPRLAATIAALHAVPLVAGQLRAARPAPLPGGEAQRRREASSSGVWVVRSIWGSVSDHVVVAEHRCPVSIRPRCGEL